MPGDTGASLRGRLALAAVVVLIALSWGLTQLFPRSVWAQDDYAALALSNAINLEFRLERNVSYEAPGLVGHGAENFFATSQGVALVISAVAVGVFVLCAGAIAPPSLVTVALVAWIAGSPFSLLRATTLTNESFALLLNSLLLGLLILLGRRTRFDWLIVALCGAVAALGYLVKLNYMYIGAALGAALLVKCALERRNPLESLAILATFIGVCWGLSWLVCDFRKDS